MSTENKGIEFETSTIKVGQVSIYAKIDKAILNYLGISPKQKGTATVVDGKIILDFKK